MRPLFLLLLAMIGHLAPAQRLFDIGLRAGANLDGLRTDPSPERTLGAHGGLFARVKPPLLPGLQGEALISSMGTPFNINEQRIQLRGTTLQVPLFLVLALGPVELHGGGYYDRLLSSGLDATIITADGVQQLGRDDLSDSGYGLLAGAGLHLGRFYATARYNHGLDPIGRGVLSDVRTAQLQFGIGWGFVK